MGCGRGVYRLTQAPKSGEKRRAIEKMPIVVKQGTGFADDRTPRQTGTCARRDVGRSDRCKPESFARNCRGPFPRVWGRVRAGQWTRSKRSDRRVSRRLLRGLKWDAWRQLQTTRSPARVAASGVGLLDESRRSLRQLHGLWGAPAFLASEQTDAVGVAVTPVAGYRRACVVGFAPPLAVIAVTMVGRWLERAAIASAGDAGTRSAASRGDPSSRQDERCRRACERRPKSTPDKMGRPPY